MESLSSRGETRRLPIQHSGFASTSPGARVRSVKSISLFAAARCLPRPRFLGPILSLAICYSAHAAPPPQEAVKQMRVADGFEVKLIASEPHIRQPLTMSFDERGRLWVVQYLQYPNPAGLKAVSVDQYLRTKYDRIPEPPPRGPKGADRITICEDTNGDGVADKFKDFVSGLNLASGMALGYGGV